MTPRQARCVVLVGTYPPTACGLATFTSNLREAIAGGGADWEVGVVRVVDRPEPIPAPEVVEQWVTGDGASLRRTVDALATVDAVVLQHEYGVFGGRDGEDVLALVDALDAPLIAVLHTVLLEPSRHQREILDHVLAVADVAVVQSRAARQRILAVHRLHPDRVVVIPHGAAANFSGGGLGLEVRPSGLTVLTWGLVGPGKGIEHGIAALSRLSRLRRPDGPEPVYVVAGRTHPKVRAAEGERYREALVSQARSLDVVHRVRFDDAYRDWASLHALVRGAHAVLLPYESRDQVSSGVLVEAVASGKPVVATRFPHAVELLSGGAGILVDHGDVDAIAAALDRVLHEPGVADRMSAAARRAARPLLWPQVGASYRTLIERVVATRAVA